MLRGTYLATVGTSGRVKIPSAWLESLREFGNRVFVTSVTGEFAQIYPMKIWNEIKQKLAGLSSGDTAKRKYFVRTKCYGQASELDGRGRVILPPILRAAAELRGEVDLSGNLDHIEVWNHARFVEMLKKTPIMEVDMQVLERFGL